MNETQDNCYMISEKQDSEQEDNNFTAQQVKSTGASSEQVENNDKSATCRISSSVVVEQKQQHCDSISLGALSSIVAEPNKEQPKSHLCTLGEHPKSYASETTGGSSKQEDKSEQFLEANNASNHNQQSPGTIVGAVPSSLANMNVNSHNHNGSNSSVDSERRYRPQKYCAVCGDKAIACNFNAVTCESCKAFFRRNAFKEQRLKCLFENRCIIDRVTRRFCSKCRLLKCFQIGMKREWILTDEQKQIKRVKIMQNKQSRQQVASIPSPSQSESDSFSGVKIEKTTNVKHKAPSRTHRQLKHSSNNNDIVIDNGRPLVETKDAATSCPDELDLLSPNSRLVNYCSLAFQCQYCSLRLTGCSAPVVSQPVAVDYHHGHHHDQLNHQTRVHYSSATAGSISGGGQLVGTQTTDGHQMPAQTNNNSVPNHVMHFRVGGGEPLAVGSASATSCCCLEAPPNDHSCHQTAQFTTNNSHQFVAAAKQVTNSHHHHQAVGAQQIPVVSTMNGLHTQQIPQLHVMTPSQVSHTISADGSMLNPVQFSQLAATQTNNHSSANSSPIATCGSATAQLSPGNFIPAAVQHYTQARNFNPFVMASDVHLLYSPTECEKDMATTAAEAVTPCQSTTPTESAILTPTSAEKTIVDDDNETAGVKNSRLEDDIASNRDETMISNSTSSEGIYSSRSSLSNNSTATVAELETQVASESSNQLGSTNITNEYAVWNGELYVKPAHTEEETRLRVERLDFNDIERQLIDELIVATRFMFETTRNDDHKSQNTLNDVVYFCDAALRRLIKTVKQIKAFRILGMDDQIVLLKAACFKILLLRSSFHYQDACEGWIDAKTGKILRLDVLKESTKSLVYEKHKELFKTIPEPLRKDRLIMAILSLALLFDPSVNLQHSNSVSLDNLIYLSVLRKYLVNTQPDPLSKYESLVSALEVINNCNEEYNIFFSKDFQPEQVTPLLIEIFDISLNNSI